jgi:putative transposase
MKRGRFSEEQIIAVLREHEAGAKAAELARKHGISERREHDRDDRCRLLCCEDWWGVMRENDIDLEPDQLGGDLREALGASLRPANLDRDIAAVDPTKFAQPLNKSGELLALRRRHGRAQESDGRSPQSVRMRHVAIGFEIWLSRVTAARPIRFLSC